MENKSITELIAKELCPIIEKLSNNGYKKKEDFKKDWVNVFNKAYVLEQQQLIDWAEWILKDTDISLTFPYESLENFIKQKE